MRALQKKWKLMTIAGIMLVAAVLVFWGFGKENKLTSVAVFSLEACNGCTQTKQELAKIKTEYPNLKFLEYNIETQADIANRYGVKVHPTVLFLNQEALEIGRIEKRTDYATLKEKILALSSNPPKPIALSGTPPPAPGSVIHTFYLLNRDSGEYQAIKQFVPQKTQVNFDKINVVNYLLEFRKDLPANLQNPVPANVKLIRSISEDDISVMLMSDELDKIADPKQKQQAVQVIVNTLFELRDVKKVQIRTGNFSSQIYEGKASPISSSREYAPAITGNTMPVKGIREYNANILFGKEIAFLPCFCGCGPVGHQSNFNCFFKKFEDGGLYTDMHGKNCDVCMEITRMFLQMKAEGHTLKEIRTAVDKKFEGSKPTNTPQP